MHHVLRAIIGLSVCLATAAGVHAQTAPLEQFDAALHVDSGLVHNRTSQRDVIFSTVAASAGK